MEKKKTTYIAVRMSKAEKERLNILADPGLHSWYIRCVLDILERNEKLRNAIGKIIEENYA